MRTLWEEGGDVCKSMLCIAAHPTLVTKIPYKHFLINAVPFILCGRVKKKPPNLTWAVVLYVFLRDEEPEVIVVG